VAASSGVHGFMPALTSFVGRADDTRKLHGLLGEYRLVTVTGPGGVGKTRLASEVARQAADRYADGAWLVELAAVRDDAVVATVAATALGVQQAAGLSVMESLAAVLARRQLLLVLDNCEQVLGAVTELCGSLLSAADDLTVLATSREPLGMAGETRYRLRPLPVPGPDGPPATRESPAAVELFAERARQADPHVDLGDAMAAVGQLVARLDGMPLAIELAAARVETLGLAQLLGRLEDRFALLTGGDRLAAARQQSLAATVDWSYQLLSDQDRWVFRRLAVFPGPFTLDAAAAVAGTDAQPAVLHLVDCSLLTPPQAGPDGRLRYAMLETLRAFGLDRLADEGERPSAESALAAHALAVAEQGEDGMRTGDGEIPAAGWLDAEDAAVHQGLAWALDHDAPAALRLAVALAPWWQLRGRWIAGYGLLQRAAERTSPEHRPWYMARFWLGRLAGRMGDYPAAFGHLTVVCDALSAGLPSPELALALAIRSNALLNLSRLPEAADDARLALSLARHLGDPVGEALALAALSSSATYDGETHEALTWGQRAHDIDKSRLPGWIARRCTAAYATALSMAGDAAAAQRLCVDGLAQARRAGDVGDQAIFLYLAVVYARFAGQMADAGAYLGECIALASRNGGRLRMVDCLDECGFLCAATGRWAEAVTLWSAYAARLRAMGVPDVPRDLAMRQEQLSTAAQALDAAQMSEAEERGAAMTLDAAAELAVMLTRPDPPPAKASPGWPELSARERELVTLVAQGQTDAQIAGQLFISVSTVRSHLDRIRDKTSCRRRADLTRLALQTGLV
jgi:serine/threonine-protein kinase PknK